MNRDVQSKHKSKDDPKTLGPQGGLTGWQSSRERDRWSQGWRGTDRWEYFERSKLKTSLLEPIFSLTITFYFGTTRVWSYFLPRVQTRSYKVSPCTPDKDKKDKSQVPQRGLRHVLLTSIENLSDLYGIDMFEEKGNFVPFGIYIFIGNLEIIKMMNLLLERIRWAQHICSRGGDESTLNRVLLL